MVLVWFGGCAGGIPDTPVHARMWAGELRKGGTEREIGGLAALGAGQLGHISLSPGLPSQLLPLIPLPRLRRTS